ncbi:MAG: alpha/beta hydrolase [Pseudomonadota bacterium]
MSAEQLELILERFGAMSGAWTEATSLETMRADFEAFFADYPEAAAQTEITSLGGVPCERVIAPSAHAGRAILLLHGGGFSVGSARAHRPYATHLSEAARAVVYTVDYRLAPEAIFPAAVEDAYAAYQALLGDPNIDTIAVCGDSAGGGLALSLLVQLRNGGLEQPASCALVSPWADLACNGASYIDNADLDPISNKDMALSMAQAYLGDGAAAKDPAASPIYGDLGGVAPMTIYAGTREIFLDDAKTIASKIQKIGGAAELNVWQGMIHQWPLHIGRLDEADAAVKELGAFFRKHWD